MTRFFLSSSLSLCLTFSISAGIPLTSDYYGPTEMLIARESWDSIESSLIHFKVPLTMIPLFDSIAKNEDWGHIGYHGANHEFRFYQDVIKLTLQEILAIQIREDFQFLRIPGDSDLNLNSIQEFTKYWKGSVNNRDELRARQLLSLNYGIYSNFTRKRSCSVCLFASDSSRTEVDYVEELVPFYEKLGISKKV